MNILNTFKHYIRGYLPSNNTNIVFDIHVEPPPVQRTVIPFERLDMEHSLRGAKGTLVTMDPNKVVELFPYICNSITGPGPSGLYCILVSEFNDVKKKDILEAQKIGIILQYSIDVYEIVN